MAELLEAFEQACFQRGDQTAVEVGASNDGGGGCDVGLDELLEWSRELAAQLGSRFGVREGDAVLLLLRDGEHAAAQTCAMLACLRLGALWVAGAAWTPAERERLRFIVQHAAPRAAVVVGEDDTAPDALWLASECDLHRTVLVSADGSLCYKEAIMCVAEPPAPRRAPDSSAYLQFTSGTTAGTAKGVRASLAGLVNRIQWQAEVVPFERGEVCLRRTPIAFVDAVAETLAPLVHGVPQWASADPDHRRNIVGLVRAAVKANVSRLTVLPSQLAQVVRQVPCWPSLRLVVISGEPVTPRLVDSFRAWATPEARLVSLYGSTEVAGDVCWIDLTRAELNPPKLLVDGEMVTRMPLGAPITGVSVWVDNPAGKQIGEILVSGPALGKYVDGCSGTGFSIISQSADPSSRKRVFRTGDLGFMHDGVLHWVGRCDNQRKIRGVRVELDQIEAETGACLGIPAGRSCVILHGREEDDDQKLVLCIEAGALEYDERASLAMLSGNLFPAHVPHRIFITPPAEPFPRTASGKIDRVTLIERYFLGRSEPATELGDAAPHGGDPSVSARFVSAPGYDVVIATLNECLGTALSPEDLGFPFVALGGDSMLAVRLAWMLGKCELDAQVLSRIAPGPAVLLGEESVAQVLWGDSFRDIASAARSMVPARARKRPGPSQTGHELQKVLPSQHITWSVRFERCVDASPLVLGNQVLVGSHGGDVASVDLESGKVTWSVSVPGRVHAAVVPVGADRVLVASYSDAAANGRTWLTTLETATGTCVGRVAVHAVSRTSPVVAHRYVWLGTDSECLARIKLEDTRQGASDSLVAQGAEVAVHDADAALTPMGGGIAADILVFDPPCPASKEGLPVMAVVATVEGRVVALGQTVATSPSISSRPLAPLEEVWAIEPGMVQGSPVRAKVPNCDEEAVVFGTACYSVHCIRTATGEALWTTYTGGPVFSRPFLLESAIVVGCYDRSVLSLKFEDGSEQWRADLDGAVAAAPTRSGSHIVAATTAGTVFWLDVSDGTVAQRTELPGEVFSDPTPAGPQSTDVVLGCRDDRLRRLAFRD